MIPSLDGREDVTRGRILIADDDELVRRLLVTLLKPMGYEVEETPSGEAALRRIQEAVPDLALLDLHLPGRSGHEVLMELRASERTRFVPVVMLTGSTARDEKLKAVEAGVTDFIVKPFDIQELIARVRSLIRLKFLMDDLENAEQVIIALARVIDARDPYTARHSERVSRYARLLGQHIGLRGNDLKAVTQGGLFHDLGKIAIRDDVLLKPGKLTPDERGRIQLHPVRGRDLLGHMKSLEFAMPIVYYHHERMDGSGYPDGLSGESIPFGVRVTSIADVWDALTTARVYRPAIPPREAMTILREEARKGWWDPRLVDEFRKVVEGMGDQGPKPGAAPLEECHP